MAEVQEGGEMSRELKFRLFFDGKFHYWGFVEGCFRVFTTSTEESMSMQEIEEKSQQYIGLYGIGKTPRQEIYEGDIVRVQTSSGMFTGEVKYSAPDGYCLVWPYDDMGKDKQDAIPIAGMAYYGFAILGNIHEQPTLLKELHELS